MNIYIIHVFVHKGMRIKLNEMVNEEELIMKDELRNSLRSRAEAAAVALNVLADDHRQRYRYLCMCSYDYLFLCIYMYLY
jgi:hypothetical protein